MPKSTSASKPSTGPAPRKEIRKGKRKLPPKAEIGTVYTIKRKDKSGKWREYGMVPTWKFIFNRKPVKKTKEQPSSKKAKKT